MLEATQFCTFQVHYMESEFVMISWQALPGQRKQARKMQEPEREFPLKKHSAADKKIKTAPQPKKRKKRFRMQTLSKKSLIIIIVIAITIISIGLKKLARP